MKMRETADLFGKQSEEFRAFSLYYLRPDDERLGKEDIALELGRSVRTVNRYIAKVRDAFEQSCRSAGLLPASDDSNTD